jgi:hypothetical protein
MPTGITWDQANFSWNNNLFTWEDVQLIKKQQQEKIGILGNKKIKRN